MINEIKQIFNSPKYCVIFFIATVVLFVLLILQWIHFAKKSRSIRKDAVKRSKAVIGGQVAEQVAAFLPNFPCSPADARFIGKPLDFVAFPGLEESNKIKEILLIEVKTGNSQLSEREKEVKKAVNEGRVRYVEYRVNQ